MKVYVLWSLLLMHITISEMKTLPTTHPTPSVIREEQMMTTPTSEWIPIDDGTGLLAVTTTGYSNQSSIDLERVTDWQHCGSENDSTSTTSSSTTTTITRQKCTLCFDRIRPRERTYSFHNPTGTGLAVNISSNVWQALVAQSGIASSWTTEYYDTLTSKKCCWIWTDRVLAIGQRYRYFRLEGYLRIEREPRRFIYHRLDRLLDTPDLINDRPLVGQTPDIICVNAEREGINAILW